MEYYHSLVNFEGKFCDLKTKGKNYIAFIPKNSLPRLTEEDLEKVVVYDIEFKIQIVKNLGRFKSTSGAQGFEFLVLRIKDVERCFLNKSIHL